MNGICQELNYELTRQLPTIFILLTPCPELFSIISVHVRSLSPCLELRPTAVLDRRAFRLLLFRLLSFVRGERRTRGKISA